MGPPLFSIGDGNARPSIGSKVRESNFYVLQEDNSQQRLMREKVGMCTHSVKLFKEKKKKKERTREIYRTSERARLVWRIRSDVAFQYYVISPKKTRCYFINTNRPWLITLAATMHLSGLSLRALIWVSLANTLHLSAQQNQSANVYFPTPHRLPQELIYRRSFSLGSKSALSLSKSALRRRHTYRPHSSLASSSQPQQRAQKSIYRRTMR